MRKTFSSLLATGLVGGLLGGALLTGCAMDSLGDAPEDFEVGTTMAPLLGGGPSAQVIPDQYVVVFHDEVGVASVNSAMDLVEESKENEILHTYTVLNGFAGKLDDATLDKLRRDSRVAYIERDQVMSIDATQTGVRPGLDRVDQRNLPGNNKYNDRGFNGSGVHVYVIDTGIRSHSEFGNRLKAGATAINDGRGTDDCNGHGTHVASTIAGTVTGVAKNARVHPVRVLDCNGSGSTSGVIAGVDFVRTNGVRPAVANMSLGGGASSALDSAINNLFDSGVLPVVAAGNENQDACNVSPARASKAFTVAAVDNNDRRASFSNFGSCVNIHAPGVSVRGASISGNNAFVNLSGTSMASPHVAGVAAMFLDRKNGATAGNVRNKLQNIATTGKVTNRQGSPNRLLFNDIR
ncbi:S8 family peptidase [Haliangium ochraceum]|uniref:Peptidase S8 and S53 subtilisin kexin sedolisin n=1 Tax=Haliangium ochraceum (strain DSM 14365 / JCM 11303 / SMP-2) TaxID=502025 RepID=D0LFZ7_HALO1|nr:S8 family peptidase [Haliangium ochraceum]ACY14599.1 peptidase S8 and S53 subtilisin kexin sedolisin [Haliangium ochraceum DSM 14365]